MSSPLAKVRRGSKPNPGSVVDWSHPLAHKLRFASLFNDTGRSAVQEIVNRTIGTLSGTSPPTWRGNTLACPGGVNTVAYVDFGTMAATQDFGKTTANPWSIAFRIFPPVSAVFSIAARNDGNVTAGWEISYQTGAIRLTQTNSRANMRTQSALQAQPGAWSDVIIASDGSQTATNVHIYINGMLSPYNVFVTGDGGGTSGSDAAQHLYWGGENNHSIDVLNCFNGLLDCGFLWARQLTAHDAALFHQNPYALVVDAASLPLFIQQAATTGPSVGTSTGSATVLGVGEGDDRGVGSSSGAATVVGVGSSTGPARVTQAGQQTFGTVSSAGRVTQAGQQVFGTITPFGRVTQVGTETFGHPKPNIPVEFANAQITIGLTWIEVTTRSNAFYVWSDRPLPDPSFYYGGWKEARVIQWGQITRSYSNMWDGQYSAQSTTITLSDTDRLLRQLDNDNELLGATFVVRMITDEGRRALQTPRVVFRGVIRDIKPSAGLQYQITLKDIFAALFDANTSDSQLPKRLFTTTDFPNCATDLINPSGVGYQTNGGIGSGIGTVAIDSGSGLLPKGTKFTFGGTGTIYTVSSDTLTDPETSIDFSPQTTGAVADNTVLSLIPSFRAPTATGQRVPFAYGLITDKNTSSGSDFGDGQGKPIFTGYRSLPDGFTYSEWVWVGHACYSPSGKPFDDLYFFNESVDNLSGGTFFYGSTTVTVGSLATEAGAGGHICIPGFGNWSTTNGFGSTPYRDFNSRRYTVCYLRGMLSDWALGILAAPENLGGTAFAVNAYGAESVGDGSGSLLVNIHDQYLHILQNWCPPTGNGYQSGSWLSTPTFVDDATVAMINEASFRAAKAQSQVYVTSGTGDGFRGDFVVGANNEGISFRTLVARLNVSAGVRSGFDTNTAFSINLLNTSLATTTLQTELSWVRDIFSKTWDITPDVKSLYTCINYLHTQDYEGRDPAGWRSVETGVQQDINTTAETDYGGRIQSPTVNFYMLRGKNRSTDSSVYQQGSDTVAFILSLMHLTNSFMPRHPKFSTGPAGYNYELGQVVPLTHYEGLTTSGWDKNPAQIETISVNPTTFTTDVVAFDLGKILT